MEPINESGPEQDEPENADDRQQPALAPCARLLGAETGLRFGGTDVVEGRRGHDLAPKHCSEVRREPNERLGLANAEVPLLRQIDGYKLLHSARIGGENQDLLAKEH